MAKKANLDTLNQLHKAIADYYIDCFESGEDLSSGTLAAANTFLKNNNIQVDVIEESSAQSLGITLRGMIEQAEEVH